MLTALYQDGTGTAVTPGTPLVSILDPFSSPVLEDQVPTFTGQTGRYSFTFAVPLMGPLGSWTAVWSGTINGAGVEASEVFTVVEPGDIIFPPDVVSPCGTWPVDLSCFEGIPDGVDPALVERWAQVATDRLWSLTGRRFGVCSRTIRPCRKACAEQYGIVWQYGQYMPYIVNGEWYNASPCGCRQDCSCTELCEVFLPGPVYSVSSVLIDGQVLDSDAYRVDAPGLLVRQDGGCFPACQALDLPPGEDGTFVVTYQYGIPLTEDAKAAVSEYTSELVKRCLPGCDCRLTDTDLEEAAAGGLTSLPFVDGWIRSVNPYGLPSQPRVMSPDSGFLTPRVQIWP